ncbi:hypothetical protein COHA_009961 [Chlorella ohadii]|uniref:Thioredoxin n=1 Tax=Chlorella ohadii TaxID=2649997 RepID=A0AAD5DH88_9CHLO|nr:hypothetical protein COHA_009961 [Chlorella ohadii]
MTVEAFNKLVASSSAVLIDFYTTWCGPCQVLEKNMKAIAPAWKDLVRFEKVDTEQNPAVADAFQVHKLPTLILFRDGQPVDRYEGLISGQDLDMRLRMNMMK